MPRYKAIAMSFRGTQGHAQLAEEIRRSVAKSWSTWIYGGQVSKYFHDAFLNIWDSGMKEDFHNLKSAHPDYEIWVTGHSLGGAMASLAASYLVATGLAERSKVKLVTSGQPRTGDKLFALNHDSQLDFSYRVTHWHDIVPHIPVKNDYGYYHHGKEVFYQQGMPPANFTICSGGEDNNCSNGVWHTSISDHRQYFSQLVSQYGARGCY